MTAPLVPAEVDLRDFPYMPVDIVRLFGSSFHARASDAEWRAGVTLWLKSFHQVPAASVPDDDVELARLAEFGRDLRTWRRVRAVALHGWVKADDGRLYHPVVAEKALEAWIEKLGQRKSSEAGNAKRHNLPFDPTRLDNAIEIALEAVEKLNPQSRALRKRARREAAARTLGSHTEAEWKALLKHCGNRCCKCSATGSIDKDHILPISSGGSDTIGNLQPLCPRCNAAKGRDATDYRPRDWPSCLPPGSLPSGDIYASTDFPTRSQEKRREGKGKKDNSPAQESATGVRGCAAPSDFERLLREAAGVEGRKDPGLTNTAPIAALIDDGYDLERMILPVLRAKRAAEKFGADWSWYAKAVRDPKNRPVGNGSAASTTRDTGEVWVAKDSPEGEAWEAHERALGRAVLWTPGRRGIGRALPFRWPPGHGPPTEAAA